MKLKIKLSYAVRCTLFVFFFSIEKISLGGKKEFFSQKLKKDIRHLFIKISMKYRTFNDVSQFIFHLLKQINIFAIIFHLFMKQSLHKYKF